MRAAQAVALAAGLAACSVACGDGPPEETGGTPAAAAPSDRVPAAIAPAPTDTTPLADPCLRGGTPRADVGRIMGEPDSVAYGVWFYGVSEVHFGYGVVLELRDQGELILCDPV